MNTSQAGIFASSWHDKGSEKSDTQKFWLELLHFEQAKRYRDWLPASEQGRWIITCNFREFRIYDLEFPRAEPEIILLENLESECQKLQILVNNNAKTPREIREQKLSEQAGRLIRKFYDSIKPRYTEPNSERSKQSLNILCTRLVFLLYSEDAGIFAKNAFHDFLLSHKNTARTSLLELFAVLNQPEDQRDPYLADDLRAFRFINGGLFEQPEIEIPRLDAPDDEPLSILIHEMSEAFNGSSISPTIFGAIFESTLNDDTREEGGMHYTVIAELSKSQKGIAEGDFTPIKVSITQFYGIEINDFAVNVARTALYIAEHQMRQETEAIVEIHDEYLPLKHYANIIKQNAITYQWESLIKPEDLNYIISNPPFRGARIMTQEQKQELSNLFTSWKSAGNIDYVACWYVKAFRFMKGSNVRAAFVSTNSINQGDNVSVLWKDLFAGGFNINFAYRSFIWENKAEKKAHVHCVILGFNVGEPDLTRHIYEVLDDGNYLFTRSEYLAFIAKEPKSQQYFHLWYGEQPPLLPLFLT